MRALIVAHGQPSDPLPAAAALDRLALRVAGHLPGWDVRAATLAEAGRLEAQAAGGPGLVFPLFMAGGWFTGAQIPARLREAGAEGWRVLAQAFAEAIRRHFPGSGLSSRGRGS